MIKWSRRIEEATSTGLAASSFFHNGTHPGEMAEMDRGGQQCIYKSS